MRKYLLPILLLAALFSTNIYAKNILADAINLVWCGTFASASCDEASTVVFEENFNDQDDWYSPHDDVSCRGWEDAYPRCPGDERLPNWDMYLTEENWHPDGQGYANFPAQTAPSLCPTCRPELTINNEQARSGKSLLKYTESSKDPGDAGFGSDAQLVATNFGEHPELFVSFWIKFDPTWTWVGPVDSSGKFKLFRIGHWDGDNYPWNNAERNSMPMYFFDMKNTSDYGFQHSHSPRCAPHYGSGSCDSPPVGSVDDNEQAYPYTEFSGTGYNGTPTFDELFGDGEWHQLEFRFTMNSANDAPDGKLYFWADGVLSHQVDNIVWKEAGASPTIIGWNWFSIAGNTSNWPFDPALMKEQWYAIDDLTICTQRDCL